MSAMQKPPLYTDGGWLSDQLQRAFTGDPWHGSSLSRILEGVDAAAAAARPLPAAHSIWELVLHVAAWAGETARRLGGTAPAEPPEGDWPEVGEATPERWSAALAMLAAAHAEAQRAIAAFPPGRWGEVAQRDAASGAEVTFAQLVNGLVQHDAYHGGQIALLKKALTPGG